MEALWQAKEGIWQKGLEDLERWLCDIMRMGLARLRIKLRSAFSRWQIDCQKAMRQSWLRILSR
ncbi:MAG: hypothetical protein R2865_05160 [Deinococcales bacterium]